MSGALGPLPWPSANWACPPSAAPAPVGDVLARPGFVPADPEPVGR